MEDHEDYQAVIALDPRDADMVAQTLDLVSNDFPEGGYTCRRLRRVADQIRGAIPAGAT